MVRVGTKLSYCIIRIMTITRKGLDLVTWAGLLFCSMHNLFGFTSLWLFGNVVVG